MKPRNRSWAVDLPGLTEDEADLVVEFARSLPGVLGASTTDPRFMMTIGMDRYGVETIARALRAQSATEADAVAMLEIFDEWLEYADPAQTWINQNNSTRPSTPEDGPTLREDAG